jgi:hypothetical protein
MVIWPPEYGVLTWSRAAWLASISSNRAARSASGNLDTNRHSVTRIRIRVHSVMLGQYPVFPDV